MQPTQSMQNTQPTKNTQPTQPVLKGIIFDLDGTLLDTEKYQYLGWVEVMKTFGVSVSKNDYSKYIGKKGEHIAGEMIKKYGISADRNELAKKKYELVKHWFETKKLELMPFAKESIDFFTRKKLNIALASGGSKDEVMIKLRSTHLINYFNSIVTQNDVNRGKPYPDIYEYTLKKMGLRPENVVVFEDNATGLEAAKAAGIKCIVIPHIFSAGQDLSKADGVFKSLKEATEWVDRIFFKQVV